MNANSIISRTSFFGLGAVNAVGRVVGIDAEYFAKNSFWVSFKNGVGMMTGFFMSIAFARLVSKEAFGQYNFILSTMYLVTFFSIPKLDFALSQSMAKGYDGSLFRATKASVLGSLISSIVMLAVAGRYFSLGDPVLGMGLLMVAIFFPLMFGFRSFDHFLIGKKRFDLSSQYAAISSVMTGVSLIVAMLLGASVVTLILLFLLVNGGLNVIFFLKSKGLVKNIRSDPDVIRYGVYLTALALTAMIMTRLGSVLLSHFKGAETLAVYSIAIIIPKAVQNLMQNFIDVAKIKVADRNRKELLEVMKKHGLKWVALGFGTFIALWVVLPILIPLIYSNKYNDAILFSQVASFSLALFPINTFLGTLVLLEKKRKIIALSHFIPSVPNMILVPVAISLFGIWGLIGVNILSGLYMIPFNLWAFFREKDL